MFPQLFGKYVLEREIAAGGMARVYLATLRGAVGFEKRLVVKQIRPELASDDAFVRRFVEEAKTAVELGHPNIVPVYELGVEQGIYYIAMEHCEGATLAEVLAETGSLSPEEGAYVGTEICRALDYSHRRAGVVHRDVTPRNVMLDEEGAVRVIDFGIAAPVTLEEEGHDRQEVFGSPGHMPPEQIAGGSLTPATDVFAVAVLLTEAWTGQPPFRRATVGECRAALGVKPPSIAEARPELAPLAELLAASMSLDPELRPQTAEALARPLREFVKSADLGDLARRLGARVRRTRRKLLASAPWLLSSDDDREAPQVDATPPAETKPRSPSFGDTQTFAVRDDMVEWTRKLPSVAPPPDDDAVGPTPASETLSTRRLAGLEDPSAEDTEAGPGSEAAEAPEGVATSGERASRSDRSSRAWLAIPALLAAVGLGWWGARSTLPARELPGSEAATNASPTPTPSPSATPFPSARTRASGAPASSSPPPLLPVAPPAAPSVSAAWVPPGTAPSSAPTGFDSTTVPAGKATLSLTANPPSSVSVAGRTYGTTPVMGLQLPAGRYFVSFDNPTLGLRTGASVTLVPGGRRAVHADFTLATPSVSVR